MGSEPREMLGESYKQPNLIVKLWNKITGKEEKESYLEVGRVCVIIVTES